MIRHPHCLRERRSVVLLGFGLLFVLASCAPEPPPSPPHPGARWGHTFVYDPVRGEVLLFGGSPERGRYLGDTWTFADGTWREHTVEGPTARGFSAAAFDASRGVVVIHGGRSTDGSTLSDTWSWNGRSWSRLEESSDFVADHHAMVFVPESETLFAFGGWSGEVVLGDSWVWEDGWRRLEVSGPPPRSAFGMAYDAALGRVLLHGGLWINGQYADVWQWDGSVWEAMGGPYDNSSLDHHGMVFDAEEERLLVFGGKNYRYRPLGRISTVHEGMVRSLSAGEGGPQPRHSVGLTWDSTQQRMLLYGGKFYRLDEHVALADLWEWRDGVWRLLEAPPSWAPLKRPATTDRRDARLSPRKSSCLAQPPGHSGRITRRKHFNLGEGLQG